MQITKKKSNDKQKCNSVHYTGSILLISFIISCSHFLFSNIFYQLLLFHFFFFNLFEYTIRIKITKINFINSLKMTKKKKKTLFHRSIEEWLHVLSELISSKKSDEFVAFQLPLDEITYF